MFIIRFMFYFTLSFGIMCIPVGNDQHLFDKLHEWITPYADKAVETTKKKISSTKRYSRKLYSNSEPLEKDEVKTKFSGIKKNSESSQSNSFDEPYTEEEKARLRRALSDQ